ncbi:MAG: adenylyl-sulfate kinase [Alphaproteobacteria bacterium]
MTPASTALYAAVSHDFRDMGGSQASDIGKTVRSTDITAVDSRISPPDRASRNGHKGGVLWLTGLPGSGKSTLAVELERRLFKAGYNAYMLDGDNIRYGLSSDLGFSPEDRAENIRRVGEVAALFANAGFIVITAFISPYKEDRDQARRAAGDNFHEIFVKADLSVCESRDPKGLYGKARRGEIPDFTGISAPYEEPGNPDFTIDTAAADIDASATSLTEFVAAKFTQWMT